MLGKINLKSRFILQNILRIWKDQIENEILTLNISCSLKFLFELWSTEGQRCRQSADSGQKTSLLQWGKIKPKKFINFANILGIWIA